MDHQERTGSASIPELQATEGSNSDRPEKPAHAIQLVHTDESGQLQLNESAVQTCFLDGEISDYPVCLICVIGEKRRGKSFLMNYILRALSCQEQGLPLSLGADDAPLSGFEWRAGINCTTKGIWIWNKPFILERNGEKMAVFVLDTEGSLDIQSSRDICLKLSALSMILSSYMIFNVNSNLKTTEMDYLELYLDVAENVGKSLDLPALQHLNILIRDWQDFVNCGKEDARAYVFHETEKLQNTLSYNLVSKTLRGPLADCSLLPDPGRGLQVDSQGKLSEMEEDFKNLLTNYIFTLVDDIWLHRKTNRQGENLTCPQLATILKRVVTILQSARYNFNSPLQMFFTFENHKNMEKLKMQFQNDVWKMSQETDSLITDQNVTPSQMASRINERATGFLLEFEQSLQGDDTQEKERLVNQLKSYFSEHQQEFCKDYSQKFYEFQNQKSTENIKEEFQTQITIKECKKVSLIKKDTHPFIIQNELSNITKKLLADYKESLEGIDDQQKQRLVNELKPDFLQKKEMFCEKYNKIFVAWKSIDTTKRKFKNFLDQMEEESSSLWKNLMKSPSLIQSKINDTVNDYLVDFLRSLEGIEAQEQRFIKDELERCLIPLGKEFGDKYSSDYNSLLYKISAIASGSLTVVAKAVNLIIKNKIAVAQAVAGAPVLPVTIGVIGVAVIVGAILVLRKNYANKSTQ
uniref:GB1/RHD3-type G domain-containing protein n=1 Tax=Xenopus laevis TaxID=8355 RepID=B7ZRQ0_XENLA|nr:Hypothetical protein LOC100127269 [Xenopus laevis]